MNLDKSNTMQLIAECVEEALWGSYYLQTGKDYCIVRTLKKGDLYIRVEQNPPEDRARRLARSGGKEDYEFLYWCSNGNLNVARGTPEEIVAAAQWMGA